MTIPEALKLLRKQRGWTQRQLAAELRKAEGTVKHWEIGIREPSAEICEKLGALSITAHLADYWAERAGLPPYSGAYLPYRPPPLAREPGVPPTDAQTRMELHAGLDIILDRAPQRFREKVAREITRGAGRFGSSPVSSPAGQTPTPQEQRLMRLLARTLDSGNAETIEAVTKTLEVFARYVETQDPKSPAAADTETPTRRLKPRDSPCSD